MITLDDLFAYKEKINQEIIMANAKMKVICDLIADAEARGVVPPEEQATEYPEQITYT